MTASVWFTTEHCLWDIISVRPGWDQCIYAAYLKREVAQREVDVLRKAHPLSTICLKVSDFRLGTP